jgi:hypothetical protein
MNYGDSLTIFRKKILETAFEASQGLKLYLSI